jgi:hypothetical protein
MSVAAAERTAGFLLDRVGARWGRLGDQGARAEPLAVERGWGPGLQQLAQRRVRGVPDAVAAGVCAWARGQRPVDLLEHVPTARQVLGLQAQGRRCVSLLPDEAARAHGDPRHPDGLTFALHDLCHVEKFVSAEHHRGQVGFFRALAGALGGGAFGELEAGFDGQWRADRDYVISDMNGSAIFLFAVLKMKTKMAVRRKLRRGRADPIDAEERAACDRVIDVLVDALGLPSDLREAGQLVNARRDHPALARRLLAHFESLGGATS